MNTNYVTDGRFNCWGGATTHSERRHLVAAKRHPSEEQLSSTSLVFHRILSYIHTFNLVKIYITRRTGEKWTGFIAGHNRESPNM